MFGKKKYSKEELETLEQNLDQGNRLLLEFSEKKEWVDTNYEHVAKSRQQMENDLDRITEHIVSASEVSKRNSELSVALLKDMDTLREDMLRAEEDYANTVHMVEKELEECRNLVEENKHFTTPSKYLSELPAELHAMNESYQESLSEMSEYGKQMGVLALNAAIEAGRMGESCRQFVSAAEEIRNFSKNYEEATKALSDKINASDEKITKMEEVIHHLIALLKESNMGMARLMKEFTGLKKQTEESSMRPFSEDIKTIREAVTELRNDSEEIYKSEERNRMQMEDIAEEVEEQKKSEQEIIGELQKMFYATGLYADRLQKGEN